MSQPETITLTVDPANDSNPESRVFSRIRSSPYHSEWQSDSDHTPASRHQMRLAYTPPKATRESFGVNRSTIKIVIDRTITNKLGDTVTAPETWELRCNDPVGVTAADTMEMRQELIGALDHATFLVDLNDRGEV